MKYLGALIDENRNNDSDINRCVSTFLGQFNVIYYKFQNIFDLCMISFFI